MTSGYRTRLAGINGAGPPAGARPTEGAWHAALDAVPVNGPPRRSR